MESIFLHQKIRHDVRNFVFAFVLGIVCHQSAISTMFYSGVSDDYGVGNNRPTFCEVMVVYHIGLWTHICSHKHTKNYNNLALRD